MNGGTSLIRTGVPRSYEKRYLAHKSRGTSLIETRINLFKVEHAAGTRLGHEHGAHTLHSTLYTLHSTLYTLHSTLYTLHLTLYTLYSSLYTLQSTPFSLHSAPYTLHSRGQTSSKLSMPHAPDWVTNTAPSLICSLSARFGGYGVHAGVSADQRVPR